MFTSWIMLLLSGAMIVIAGTRLSRYGDQLAELTGLGRLWVGVVLMAAATSLPEVLTTVSAGWMNAPDLAAGDLFGAGLANMFTLGLIDLLHRDRRVWEQTAFEHTLVASLAMILTGLAAFFVLLRSDIGHGGIGAGSVLLLLVYIFGMRVVFRQEDVKRRQRAQHILAEAEVDSLAGGAVRRDGLRRAAIGFGAATLALIIAAPLLAKSAKDIADQSGISTTFVGTCLVAVVTTLPELVTSLAAVRLGAFDLAVGNLFGSNAFNMAAFFFADLAYGGGPLLSAIEPAHALTALWGILMMNVGLMGIVYRVEKRYVLIEPDSLVMILGYVLGLWLLFG
ncbi:MAG: sodium:calcium antiporter [Nitrospira defluvii]|nr:sodium:calcium antiporter [Nitrospira defluvii]